MPRSLRRALVALSACAATAIAVAQSSDIPVTTKKSESNGFGLREQVLRMTDFFDTVLPGTLAAQNVTLHFTPKFSDVRDRQFIRYPVELRYGATDRLELRTGITPFGVNPLRKGRDRRWGPGEFLIGGRYDLNGPLFFYDKATIGLDNRIPLGKPPVDLNDGYTHVRPWLATSRTLRTVPFTTFYTNFSYDRSVKLTHREPLPPEIATRRHIAEVAPGLLYKPGELGYFGEYRFRHFQEPDSWHLGHEIKFGTIWDVPLWRTAQWDLPGKWQLEVAYRFTTEEGRGHSQGVTARVNWKTSLREVVNHLSKMTKLGN